MSRGRRPGTAGCLEPRRSPLDAGLIVIGKTRMVEFAMGRGGRTRTWEPPGTRIEAQLERAAVKREYDAALAGVDALLTPAVRTAAPAVADIDLSTTAVILTRLVNVIDCCALAVPNGMTAGGLPLSLQIICRGHEEATALRIGLAYQEATDWHVRVPPGLDAAAD